MRTGTTATLDNTNPPQNSALSTSPMSHGQIPTSSLCDFFNHSASAPSAPERATVFPLPHDLQPILSPLRPRELSALPRSNNALPTPSRPNTPKKGNLESDFAIPQAHRSRSTGIYHRATSSHPRPPKGAALASCELATHLKPTSSH